MRAEFAERVFFLVALPHATTICRPAGTPSGIDAYSLVTWASWRDLALLAPSASRLEGGEQARHCIRIFLDAIFRTILVVIDTCLRSYNAFLPNSRRCFAVIDGPLWQASFRCFRVAPPSPHGVGAVRSYAPRGMFVAVSSNFPPRGACGRTIATDATWAGGTLGCVGGGDYLRVSAGSASWAARNARPRRVQAGQDWQGAAASLWQVQLAAKGTPSW